jgi:hypothetical protein
MSHTLNQTGWQRPERGEDEREKHFSPSTLVCDVGCRGAWLFFHRALLGDGEVSFTCSYDNKNSSSPCWIYGCVSDGKTIWVEGLLLSFFTFAKTGLSVHSAASDNLCVCVLRLSPCTCLRLLQCSHIFSLLFTLEVTHSSRVEL